MILHTTAYFASLANIVGSSYNKAALWFMVSEFSSNREKNHIGALTKDKRTLNNR